MDAYVLFAPAVITLGAFAWAWAVIKITKGGM